MRFLKNRTFIASFSISLILILTGFAMTEADYRSRVALTGDSSPEFSTESRGSKTYLRVNAFGNKKEYDISTADNILDSILDFFCLPVSADTGQYATPGATAPQTIMKLAMPLSPRGSLKASPLGGGRCHIERYDG